MSEKMIYICMCVCVIKAGFLFLTNNTPIYYLKVNGVRL